MGLLPFTDYFFPGISASPVGVDDLRITRDSSSNYSIETTLNYILTNYSIKMNNLYNIESQDLLASSYDPTLMEFYYIFLQLIYN